MVPIASKVTQHKRMKREKAIICSGAFSTGESGGAHVVIAHTQLDRPRDHALSETGYASGNGVAPAANSPA